MTDRKIMTSAAAIFAATFATASLAQDALNNPQPGLGADAGQVEMDTSPAGGGLGGGDVTTSGAGAEAGAGAGTGVGTTGTGTTGVDAGATGTGTAGTDQGAGTGTVGGNVGTMTEGQGTPPAGAGAGAGAYGAGGAAAGGDQDWNYGMLVSQMRTDADFSAELEDLDDSTEIRIIRIGSFQGEGAENAEGMDQALEENEEALTTGRDAIRENERVTEALEEEEFDADDVVAVRRGVDGTLEVVVDDRDDS